MHCQTKQGKCMKWSEFIKQAEAEGWRFWKNGGRHDQYRHPDRKDIMVIPRHRSKEIPNGLMLKLKKQLKGE